LLFSLIAISFAQQATNTTDFVPPADEEVPAIFQKGAPGNPEVFVTPPPKGAIYHDYLVIDEQDIGSLPQNQIAVFFTNGGPVFRQNLPNPYPGNPDKKTPQGSNCHDAKETGAEVCDYGLNSCCDTKAFCGKFLPVGNPCIAPGTAIVQSLNNRKCFTDTCQAVAGATQGNTTCVRTFAAPVTPIPKNPKKATFTACFTAAASRASKRLNKRGASKRRKHRRKVKKFKNLNPNAVYCDGTGHCNCESKGCSQTPIV